MKAYKGKFTPQNYSKYEGDPTNIIFRSGWERKAMKYLDENVNVLLWSSEEIAIPYRSPVDNRVHRYFPDFKITVRSTSGEIKTYLVEVKPLKQIQEPEKKKRITKAYITEVATWGVNSAKWEAARSFCKNKGWEFMLVTEKDLGIR